MQVRSFILCIAACISPTLSLAETPVQLFQKGLALELTGTSQSTHLAFLNYLKAAQSGLPEAQFNVAVMLDSGRGVETNLASAAIWYARAALHGNQRASYNLGQLYENGQGVPMNHALAREWFAASDLPAALDYLRTQLPSRAKSKAAAAPTLLWPGPGEVVTPVAGDADLVWTATDQPVGTRSFVELCTMIQTSCAQVTAQFADKSGIVVSLPPNGSIFFWRVYSVDWIENSYQASAWSSFEINRQ